MASSPYAGILPPLLIVVPFSYVRAKRGIEGVRRIEGVPFLALPFFNSKELESFSLFERCSTARPCADKRYIQIRMLAFADGCSAHQHLVLRTYTFHKAFFSYYIITFFHLNLEITKKSTIFAAQNENNIIFCMCVN